MTKPGGPPEATDKVVEMDAMDVLEWEQEQRTPQASDANLAALVRESTRAVEPIAEAPPRKTPLVARGRVTGLVSPQPPRPGGAPAASGMLAETPALPIEKVTPAVPIPVIEAPPVPPAPTANPEAPAKPTVTATPAPPARPAVPVKPAPPPRSAPPIKPAPPARSAPPAKSAVTATPAPPAKSPPPVKSVPAAKSVPPGKPAVTAGPAPSAEPAPPAEPALPAESALPARPALPRAVSLRTSEVPPLPRSPLRSPTRPDPESMPSSSRPLSPMRVGVARAGSALSSVDAGPASVAEPGSPFGAHPAPSVPRASIVDPVVPSLAAPALDVEPANVAEPASVAEPVSVAERAAATGWQPASVAGFAAPSGAQPALDEVGHRASSPMPVETGIARMASPWPASIERAHGPDPLAASDPAASLPAGPGSRRGRRDRRATVKTRGLLAVAASHRKVLWIGGAAGCVALVAVLVLVGGGKPRAVATSVRADHHAQGAVPSRSTAAAPEVPAAPPARTTAALDTPAVPSPPASAAPAKAPVPDAPAVRPAPRPAKQLGGKKLVVEYIEREGEVATPGLVAKTAEDPAIGRARSAYLSGNQKLFAGDAASAIYAYRQALALYPGYVGGYRGLGLAYAQLGDTPKALEAFRTYTTAVPNAKDIALIRKRIARLQGK